MVNMKNTIHLLLILLLPSCCLALQNELVSEAGDGIGRAEVDPGRFIEYREHVERWELKHKSFTAVHVLDAQEPKFYQRDTTYLSIPWQGQDLLWVGFGVPICLRSHNNLLYLVVFDRDSDLSKTRFRYYRQDHSVLAEIAAKDFPREIAVQNLWLSKENGFRDGKPINQVEIAKNLDPEDIDFPRSLTAKMWMHLETGKEYYETQNDSASVDFLKRYLRKHDVVRLKTIQE